MFLSRDDFSNIINCTPLVSIDLVLRDDQGKILLGLRSNRPALGFWFVPGGRIRKRETLDAAFSRICQEELMISKQRSEAEFLGVYEHHYADSAVGNNIQTHYVVLAYQLCWSPTDNQLPCEQHVDYQWLSLEQTLFSEHVHSYTKDYVLDLTKR
ncbi:GDP-mannose mannosyl hydrolase [Litchfieldella rifensis]|uniref:GDP-mannose mannosyl hydrolase n=1 Tax=Litchfieldella rifensis TaxID=762643 RepID=A0ABV7LTC1_9GAMM